MSDHLVSTPSSGDKNNAPWQVFAVFLRLGCLSFGGPSAHLAYFRHVFVEQRRWLSDQEYAALVALSQFLPGPGSSQVGFALGMTRAGLSGGVAAFAGFTLPSFLLMFGFALSTAALSHHPIISGITHGLKLLAIVVVADACLGMFKSFCRQTLTQGIALAAFLILLLFPMSSGLQILLLILAATAGGLWLTSAEKTATDAVMGTGHDQKSKPLQERADQTKPRFQQALLWITLVVMPVLLLCSVLIVPEKGQADLIANFLQFFQIGSLVFGGGHVVLPLMEGPMLEQMSSERFLTGYSLAQAMPGPMFTLASFMGAEIGWLQSQQVVWAALVAFVVTLAVFLPGLLLMAALLPYWQSLSRRPRLMAIVQGLNAVVVGFLLQALAGMLWLTLWQPFSSISGELPSTMITTLLPELILIVTGWVALRHFNCSVLWLVLGFALSGGLLSLL